MVPKNKNPPPISGAGFLGTDLVLQKMGSLGRACNPCMNPQFLKGSLPLLRSALRFGAVTIDGVRVRRGRLHKDMLIPVLHHEESMYNHVHVEREESGYREAIQWKTFWHEFRLEKRIEIPF